MQHLKLFEENNTKMVKFGNKLKRELRATKKENFFDWNYEMDDDIIVTFKFYWNSISTDYIYWIYDFMKSHQNFDKGFYNCNLETGKHDIHSGKSQIVLKIEVPKNLI